MLQQNEVTLEEFRHLVSERALTGDTVLLNMGPQHPSTHGVLRLLLELDGETVINCIPDIGFLHTGIEKNMEAKTYEKAEVMTDRMDYLNTVGNNLVYCLAIEKIAELDVPVRAQSIRVILTELQRIASHLVWLGTHALDLAAMSIFLYCFREREMILDILEMCSGQRMMTTYFRPGGLWRDVPAGFEEAVRQFVRIFPKRIDQYESLLTKIPYSWTAPGILAKSPRSRRCVGGSPVPACAALVRCMTCARCSPTAGMSSMNLRCLRGATAMCMIAISCAWRKCASRWGL
jgi:NADH-quinone oxidoreductase subunit D